MIKAMVFDLGGVINLADGLFSKWVKKKYNLDEKVISEFFQKEYLLCRRGKKDHFS